MAPTEPSSRLASAASPARQPASPASQEDTKSEVDMVGNSIVCLFHLFGKSRNTHFSKSALSNHSDYMCAHPLDSIAIHTAQMRGGHCFYTLLGSGQSHRFSAPVLYIECLLRLARPPTGARWLCLAFTLDAVGCKRVANRSRGRRVDTYVLVHFLRGRFAVVPGIWETLGHPLNVAVQQKPRPQDSAMHSQHPSP